MLAAPMTLEMLRCAQVRVGRSGTVNRGMADLRRRVAERGMPLLHAPEGAGGKRAGKDRQSDPAPVDRGEDVHHDVNVPEFVLHVNRPATRLTAARIGTSMIAIPL